MSEEKLLPCPFCGDEPELHWINEAGEVLTAWVRCKCGCEHHERLTKEVAVKKWNSRCIPNDAQTSWHSMDTAPKDGTEVLGWWRRSKTHAIIAWANDGWWKDSADDNMVSAPTHWQYLQDGPSVSSAGNTAQAALDGVGTADDILRLANVVDEARLAYLDAYMLGLEDMDAKEEALRQVLWDDKGTWGPALRELARRLRSPDVAAGAWQPIETAPRDGTELFFLRMPPHSATGNITIGFWHDGQNVPGFQSNMGGVIDTRIWNRWKLVPDAIALSSADRVCAKCGCETKCEEALVNGEIWCHPCADGADRGTP